MASEVLSVPEEHVGEVVCILLAGLKATPNATPEVQELLENWCETAFVGPDEEEDR